jgi:molybdenum-dependent DNA-binding transcriptional regulator ModE
MLRGMPVTLPVARVARRLPPASSAHRRQPGLVAVAQHLSISRAADVLGVSASAVSMQIKTLEDYLRVPLLRREGRTVELTAEGARLLPPVERALRELEDAIDELRAHRRAGELAVTTLPGFLQQWLLPRLPIFTRVTPTSSGPHTRRGGSAAVDPGRGLASNGRGTVEKLPTSGRAGVQARTAERHGPVDTRGSGVTVS